ncbi:FAD-dependent oxidoreductase [Gordonia sp. GONU]|uniref:FAD-dependent oxidoreductase n=1 Tax=Gordonia sp. GONU TaxID=2972949 RepID=UPI0021ACEDA6|nr:FAD-dependent oxidoreductase [Gordonia sp. GONU]MCR8896686.1 FAD-dependent oxidoreductase [Gordonia sp. GONU]
MPHVITRPCCNDASCVSVCPVNCIHPTPADPDFFTAESLYIDPDTCIDCGACVDECPVDAILPEESLQPADEPYLRINADYYRDHDVEGGLVDSPRQPKLPPGDLHVAIVGAGPAGLYAAEQLVRTARISVDMFDRLPTPHGLVRAGVAPDHALTKGVEKNFDRVAAKKNFRYLLNVTVGQHIRHEELAARYHGVIYAVGAAHDRRLSIAGEDLPGSASATDFVGWYNGHPDHAGATHDLSGDRAVVIGNGNVALDVARILVTAPEVLATTDIADHALEQLRSSSITEVVVLARRGIAHAAFTNSEFLALGSIDGVDVVIDPEELVLDATTEAQLAAGTLDSTVATKIRLAQEFSARPRVPGRRRIVFRFLADPVEIVGEGRVSGIRVRKNQYAADGTAVTPTDTVTELATGLVLRSIGYRCAPVDGLPFDPDRSVVPNEAGRVTDTDGAVIPGLYVTGWIKRGATGGIGRNRACGQETASAFLDDVVEGKLPEPSAFRDDIESLVADRGGHPIDLEGWKRIDATERAAGKAAGRPRVKLVDAAAMTALASSVTA